MRLLTPLRRHARYFRAVATRPGHHGQFDLRGRHALVTGGSHGIGAALAAELACAGADVVSVDVAPPETEHPRVEAILGDVRTFDFGTLAPFDLLVANAGVVDSSATGRLDDSDVDRLVGINLVGLIRTLDAPATDSARAVVVSSRSAVRAELPGRVYGATKAACLNYAFTYGATRPTTVAIVGMTATKLFEAEAIHQGRPVPQLSPGIATPSSVARKIVAAVRDGHECVITDPESVRDVATFSHWLAHAPLIRDPKTGTP